MSSTCRMRMDVIHSLMVNSLSFIIFELEGTIIGLNVSRPFAIVANPIVPGFALALGFVRLLGRTSSSTVRRVSRTLYF
mgnify:CR=1 FL=1